MKRIILFLFACLPFFLSQEIRAEIPPDAKEYITKITVINDSGSKVGFGVVLKGKNTSLFKGEFHEDAVVVFIAPGSKYTFDSIPEKSVYMENKSVNVLYRMVGVGFPTNNYAVTFDATSGELKIQLKLQAPKVNPKPIMDLLNEDATYDVATCAEPTEETSDDGIAPEQEVTYVGSSSASPQAPTEPTVVVSQALSTAKMMLSPRD